MRNSRRHLVFTYAILVLGGLTSARTVSGQVEGASAPPVVSERQAALETHEPSSPASAPEESLFGKAARRYLGRLQPNQGGIIWLGVLVATLVSFDFRRPLSRQNLDVLLLLGMSFLLVDIIRLGGDGFIEDPSQLALFSQVYLAIFLWTGLLLVRALIGSTGKTEPRRFPNLPANALMMATVLFFLCNSLLAMGRFPDDCGYYTNLGAAQMLETGKFPYADPTLRDGSAATYGPVLYVAHLPIQLAVAPFIGEDEIETSAFRNWLVTGGKSAYEGPPIIATKILILVFHAVAVAAIVAIGRRLRNSQLGWGLACLYVASPYVQGLGGLELSITGMTFISHIAPAAATLLAFAFLGRPLLAGGLLGVATGVLFYPAFLFPAWLGYYYWRKDSWKQFAVGFAAVCLLIGVTVLLMTHQPENESSIHAIVQSTIGHQEGKHAYGASQFSFWGTHPRFAAFWQESFVPGWYLFKPAFLVFAAYLAAAFWLARGRNITQLAFLTASVAIAVQLWKSHATATYVEWYYPFLLIGMFGESYTSESEAPSEPLSPLS